MHMDWGVGDAKMSTYLHPPPSRSTQKLKWKRKHAKQFTICSKHFSVWIIWMWTHKSFLLNNKKERKKPNHKKFKLMPYNWKQITRFFKCVSVLFILIKNKNQNRKKWTTIEIDFFESHCNLSFGQLSVAGNLHELKEFAL